MGFASPVFVFLFLPAVLLPYWLAPRAARNALLLLASLFFYAWGEPRFAPVLLGSIAVNYLLALAIGAGPAHRGGLLLGLGIAANVGLLAVYKYGNFAIQNLNLLRELIGTA